MKAAKILGIIAILFFGCVFQASAQATAYANIYATVVAPAGIEKKADMSFSQIAPTKNSSTVVLGQTAAGNGTLASFTVTGGNQTFDVTLPQGSFTISNGSNNTMLVSNFTSVQTQAASLQGNSSEVRIGATLHMAPNQATGSYNAQDPFMVTLNYN